MLLYIQRTPWTTRFWISWVQFCVEFLIDTNYRLCCSSGKESACSVRDLSWIPGLGRSAGEGKDCPLQYSGLERICGCEITNRVDWILNKFYSRVKAGSGPPNFTLSSVNYNSYGNKVNVKTPEGKLHALYISCMEPASIITFFPMTSEVLKYRVWSQNVSISTFAPRKH